MRSGVARWRVGACVASVGVLASVVAGCAGAPAAGEAQSVRSVAVAEGRRDLDAAVDKIFAWTSPEAPGCAVAAAQDGEVRVSRGYGAADLALKTPITPATVFDIGSTHKQFVAASVLLLVEEGKLSLGDNIRKFIPQLPDYGRTITVDHLLTHTSGLRDWTALLPMSAADEDALTAILRQRGLNFAPGDEFAYSNSGYVLAKEIVARVSGKPFGDFLRERITQPLGLTATLYDEDMRTAVPNKALAYNREGDGWTIAMRTDTDRGGGGVLSTVGDLLIWDEAVESGKLSRFVTEKLREPTRLNNGRVLDYGRGLFIDREQGEPSIYRHGGAAAGYQASLVRVVKPKVSIAVLCNSGEDTDQGAFARGVLDLVAPEYVGRGTEPAAVTAVAADVSGRGGVFVNEGDGTLLRLAVQGDRLGIANGPPLTATAADTFRTARGQVMFWSQDEAELRFVSNDELEVKSMEGAVTRYRRAEPVALTPAELAELAGRYASDELDTVFDVGVEQGKLAVRLQHIPERVPQFAPVTRDLFQFQQMTLRFVRDAQGKVVGLDYSNPVLRNVRMTRVG